MPILSNMFSLKFISNLRTNESVASGYGTSSRRPCAGISTTSSSTWETTRREWRPAVGREHLEVTAHNMQTNIPVMEHIVKTLKHFKFAYFIPCSLSLILEDPCYLIRVVRGSMLMVNSLYFRTSVGSTKKHT